MSPISLLEALHTLLLSIQSEGLRQWYTQESLACTSSPNNTDLLKDRRENVIGFRLKIIILQYWGTIAEGM